MRYTHKSQKTTYFTPQSSQQIRRSSQIWGTHFYGLLYGGLLLFCHSSCLPAAKLHVFQRNQEKRKI